MAEVFSNYSDIGTETETVCEGTNKLKEKKKYGKKLKKIFKQLKKQNKLLQQICNQRTKTGQIGNVVEMDEAIPKETSFLKKLSDVFLRTLPSILRLVVPTIITAIIGRDSKSIRTSRRFVK